MSPLYTTKALGRTWLPSNLPPTSRGFRPGRYGTWPLSIPSFRTISSSAQSPGCSFENSTAYGSFGRQQRRRWERIVLGAFILAVLFALGVLKSARDEDLGLARWRWERFHSRLLPPAGVVGNRRAGTGAADEVIKKMEEFEIDGLGNVTWRDFAYVTYATEPEYLCASLLLLEALERLGTKADRVLLHSDEWSLSLSSDLDLVQQLSPVPGLLAMARDKYQAQLVPVPVRTVSPGTEGGTTWIASVSKLYAFNQTRYKRVLALDADATLRRSMDELFLLPASVAGEVAMPRAYWMTGSEINPLEPRTLSSSLILLTPSANTAARLQIEIAMKGDGEYDMEILNRFFGATSMVLPHRPYLLLSGEFRTEQHTGYLGTVGDHKGGLETPEEWNAEEVLSRAKYVHFSDFPLPKPWLLRGDAANEGSIPQCKTVRLTTGEEMQDCRDRQVWEGLYQDFRERRKVSTFGQPYRYDLNDVGTWADVFDSQNICGMDRQDTDRLEKLVEAQNFD